MNGKAWAVGVAAALTVGGPASAQPQDIGANVVTAGDPVVVEALRAIHAGSPSWRAALDSVARNGGRILVATLPELTGVPDRFAREQLAEAQPYAAENGTVREVMVVINRQLLESIYRQLGGAAGDLERDLQRLLVHEIYGHAVPYLIAGHVSGACPDPATEAAAPGCSIGRENVVRLEMGLGKRHRYDLSGLALGYYVDVRGGG